MKKLYYGGTVVTLEKPMYAEAMLIEDDKIVGLGTQEELRKNIEDDDKIMEIDLDGNIIMPAFIDAHSHFSQVATGFLQVSLEGLDSIEKITKRIKEFVEDSDYKKGDWITAKDYDDTLFKEPLFLEDIDAIIPEYALVIQHKSGHMGLFNSIALDNLGITESTPNPQGGVIGKDENGLTGYLEENAYFSALKKIPMPGMNALINSYKKAQELYASYGIMTMQDGMVVQEMLPLYEMLQMTEMLKLDLVAFVDLDTFSSRKEELSLALKKYDMHLKIGGLKIFLDGSPQGRTAWMEKPYEGEDVYCGYGTMTDEQVEQAFAMAGREKLQILAHCNGDAAASQYLRCLRRAEENDQELKELKPVMIHSQFLRPDQLPEVKELGVIPSFFVAHVYYWGDVHVKNMGEDRAQKMSPANSARKNHICFTFHQDAPVIEPNMFETIWCAVKRQSKSGKILGEEEGISVLDAIKAVTINAAWQYGEEKEKGTLSLGKKADFIIVDRDPLKIEVDEIKNIKIMASVKDGIVVYRK